MSRGKGKTVNINVAVDPPMKKELERIADSKDFTLSILVRSVLREYLKQFTDGKL